MIHEVLFHISASGDCLRIECAKCNASCTFRLKGTDYFIPFAEIVCPVHGSIGDWKIDGFDLAISSKLRIWKPSSRLGLVGVKRGAEHTEVIKELAEQVKQHAQEREREDELRSAIQKYEESHWLYKHFTNKKRIAAHKELLAKIQDLEPHRLSLIAAAKAKVAAYEQERKESFEELEWQRDVAVASELIALDLTKKQTELLIASEYFNRREVMDQMLKGETIMIMDDRIMLVYREEQFHASMAPGDKAYLKQHLSSLLPRTRRSNHSFSA